jgi:glycosyltransferase involved in cell wall biosynthesis
VSALDQLADMRVLFLNWRDVSHPQAGGAEAYCHEIARRWAESGATVSLFASRHRGAPASECLDGVSIRRVGGTFGVYPAAAYHLIGNLHDYDAVIDFQNGIPFFSPVVTGRWTTTVCVIHHVHQDQFDLRFRWPMNVVGRVLEKQVSRIAYHGRPIVVVSPSTRQEVRRRLGFTNPIYVVPNGAPRAPSTVVPRSASPTIAVVNRLVPHKRIDLLLRAIPAVTRRWPDLHVDIAGDGTELRRLHALASALDLNGAADFHGRVDEERKRALLAGAWLTVVPSQAEGWGLAVIEANSVGTPALAFDVPGLQDAIQHANNGWLLEPGTDLADGINRALELLSLPSERDRIARRCLEWAGDFSWEDSAERLAEVVLAESYRVQRRRRSRRRSGDLAVVAQFTEDDADALARRMEAGLRRTDARIRNGNNFYVVLNNCDEVLALKVLRRLGISEATVTLARRRDVLRQPRQVRASEFQPQPT